MVKIGDRVRVTDNTANEEWFDVGDGRTVHFREVLEDK